jgi:hypothetical protein
MSKATSLHFEGADFDSLLRQEFLSITDLKSNHASIKLTPGFSPQEKRPQRITERLSSDRIKNTWVSTLVLTYERPNIFNYKYLHRGEKMELQISTLWQSRMKKFIT